MRKFKHEFISGVAGALFVLSLPFILLMCSGCKVLKSSKSSTKDSVSVNKVNEGSVKVDSSGSKTDKIYTKETFYFDTTINHYRTEVRPTVYIREQGQEKTEDARVVKDDSWRQALDSLSAKFTNRELDKKVKVGPSFIEWLLIAGLALLLLKNFLPFKIIKT